MGWILFLMLVVFVLAALIRFGRPGGTAAMLILAALLTAAGGYAWQGNPGLAGSPTPPRANHPASDPLFAAEREAWLGGVGPDADLLASADALIRQGSPDYAVGVLRGAIARAPDDMALWVGLGNALTTYADGSVTPAALYAFRRGAMLAPKHPAPLYLLGLAYAGAGEFDAADHVWRSLLAISPADAPYRPLIAARMATLARLRATAEARQMEVSGR